MTAGANPKRPQALEWRGPDGDPPVRPELPDTHYLHRAVRPDQDQVTVDASQG